MFLEISLIGIQHPVKPWKQLLCAVIGVQDNGDAVEGSH